MSTFQMETRKKILKTGLAAMLAGFVFLFTAPIQNSLAEDKLPLESDSAIIARHTLEMLNGESIEEFSEHSFNSHLSREQLDSILWEDERTRITGAEMLWAPDSSFRICTVEMESCGAYCNRWWTSWLHFNDGSGYVISNVELGDVENIHQMPDGKYLIEQTTYGRSGVYACRSYYVSLASFDNYKIIFHSFPDPQPGADVSESTESFGVTFCSYYGDPEECRLTYNSDMHEISFHYAEDVGLMTMPDSISVYDGTLNYADTGFVTKSFGERRIKFVEKE